MNAAPATEEARSVLQGAAEHGRIDMLQLLLTAGADFDGSGYARAIELAMEQGHTTVCALLNRCRSERSCWGTTPKSRQNGEDR